MIYRKIKEANVTIVKALEFHAGCEHGGILESPTNLKPVLVWNRKIDRSFKLNDFGICGYDGMMGYHQPRSRGTPTICVYDPGANCSRSPRWNLLVGLCSRMQQGGFLDTSPSLSRKYVVIEFFLLQYIF